MLCSTLDALFQGKKELFEGLYIQDKWDWSQSFPVIRLDMSGIYYINSTDDVEIQLNNLLIAEPNCKSILVLNTLGLDHQGYGPKLKELRLQKLAAKYQ